MTFKEFQTQAASTAIYPDRWTNLIYPVLGLVGEAGEIANKVKKIQRDHSGTITPEMRAALKSELGDVLWYLSAICDELDISLNRVAVENLEKLRARQRQGTLTGSGDAR